MNVPVGDLLVYDFTVTRLVDGETVPHDPGVVQVSLRKGDGTEDVLTYGGSDPRDEQLVRTSEGAYSVRYTADVAGMWRLRVRTGDAVAGEIEWRKSNEEVLCVLPDEHAFVDR